MGFALARGIMMTACAVLAGSCTAPAGITRSAIVGLQIDATCFERGVRTVAGLTSVESETYRSPQSSPDKIDRSSASYTAGKITEAVDATAGIRFEIYRSHDPDQAEIIHRFDRNSDRSVSQVQEKQVVDLMKRVETSVGVACGIDIVGAMSMDCGPSLNKCEGIV